MKIRRKLYFLSEKSKPVKRVYGCLLSLRKKLSHRKTDQRTVVNRSYTKEGTCYILRGDGKHDTTGLAGDVFIMLYAAVYCEKQGFMMYVDYEKSPCQYNVRRKINHTHNAWEYYFLQPMGIHRKEAFSYQTLIFSGGGALSLKREMRDMFYAMNEEERRKAVGKYVKICPYIKEKAEGFYKENFEGYHVLGVFARGTDYLSRKPGGHYVQPDVEMIEKKIREYEETYGIDKIFMVTEDFDIFSEIKAVFKDQIFCSDDVFTKYNEKEHLWIYDAFTDDPYERGERYLLRLYLLSKCDYFIGGKAAGSMLVTAMSAFKDCYMFDLGTY